MLRDRFVTEVNKGGTSVVFSFPLAPWSIASAKADFFRAFLPGLNVYWQSFIWFHLRLLKTKKQSNRSHVRPAFAFDVATIKQQLRFERHGHFTSPLSAEPFARIP